MGGEGIVVLVPAGVALLGFLIFRVARGPDRVYPAAALFIALASAGYTSSQSNYTSLAPYVTWFFIWFFIVAVPVGGGLHVVRWAIGRYRAPRKSGNAA